MAGVAAPLVSVVVRSVARPSLAAALASIGEQEYPRIDVVVVAASGRFHPSVTQWAGPHPVRLVESEAPLSRPAAANRGLAATRGEWITFLDDDDRFLAGHIAGLVAARARAQGAKVVHTLASAVFRDGRVERFGQPFSLSQLYDRNFIQLSTALIARDLLSAGCHFDESLPIHEDWDFFLQLAQHTVFHFEPLQTFEWHAEAGTSGAAGGTNQDAAAFAAVRDRVYAKWGARHEALLDHTRRVLGAARESAALGDVEAAAARCRDGLRVSPNDPHLLGFLAMLALRGERPADALRLQGAAVSVCPQDANQHFNLAVVLLAQHAVDAARRALGNALRLDPSHVRARAKLAELGPA